MNTATMINNHIHSVSGRFSRDWNERQDNLQECRIKMWQLSEKGITEPKMVMKSISNRLRDTSRKRGRYIGLKQRVSMVEHTVHGEHLWDRKKVAEALTFLPKTQADILANMIEPSEEYKNKLEEKYKGKSFIHMDSSVLAEVLGISASKLSRQKEAMLISCLKLLGPCQ